MKKWEYGLIYPSLDEIYIISELYMFPAINLIMAKNNSFKEGMDSIHYTIIKIFCYVTGVSMKVGMVILSLILVFSFVYAVNFFIQCANMFMSSRRKIIYIIAKIRKKCYNGKTIYWTTTIKRLSKC